MDGADYKTGYPRSQFPKYKMAFFKLGYIFFLIQLLEDTSGALHISINGKDISGLLEDEPIKIIEGQDFVLDCASSYPNSSFIWTKDGRQTSFNLERKVTQAQVLDSGFYNCQATSFDETKYTEIVENKSVSVEILFPPSYPTIGPEFIDGPYNALHGEDITLTCKSDAKPEPNYQWRRNNKDGPLLSRNANYRLMVESYIVDYYCVVSNQMVPTVGQAVTTSITRKLQIRVYVKAYIYKIDNGTYRTFNEGDSMSIRCIAFGRPPPKIWWTKAGDDDFHLESDMLSQACVSRKFAGDYFCHVENTVTATNQSVITTDSKQQVHITVSNSPTRNTSNVNCLNKDDGKTDVQKSKNTALLILTGIGWFGFVCSIVFHIIVYTKNRNKRREAAQRTGSAAKLEKAEQLSATSSYITNARIPDSYSDLQVYDKINNRSFSLDSTTTTDSSVTEISTVPSCDSFLPKSVSYSQLQRP